MSYNKNVWVTEKCFYRINIFIKLDYYDKMSFIKMILVLTIFLFSTNIVFIENTNSKEKVIDGIIDLTFKFPKDKNFVSKYKWINNSDKNKNSSSFIYEIGQN